MKTDKLIDMLSTNIEPVDHRLPSRALAVAVGIGAVAVLGPMLLAWGVRPDVADMYALLSLGLKLLFAGMLLVLALVSLNKIMRPGGEQSTSLAVIWSPFIAVMLVAALTLAVSPSAHWRAMLVGSRWIECLVSIPLIAIAPFALLMWAVRQAAPTDLVRAGAMAGLAAGSISAVGYALHCTDDSAPFVALWYGGTIALCTLAGAKLGPRLLRW